MGIEYAFQSMIFLLLMCSKGHGAREMTKGDDILEGANVLQLRGMDANHVNHVHKEHAAGMMHSGHVHGGSHMNHMDPATNVFFVPGDLKVGKSIPIYFPKIDPSSAPHFLPREEADSIPFSSEALPHLLKSFSISQGSPQARAMEDTIKVCEDEPLKGETKICATSLESMLDFARESFGRNTHFKGVSTTRLTKSTTLLQNYSILEEPQEINTANSKMVPCHTMSYPYAIFYCHYQNSETKVFKVLLGGENGDRAEAVAVCHMDTSQWSSSHVSFKVLGTKPGSSSVCHFFPDDNLVWVPILPTN